MFYPCDGDTVKYKKIVSVDSYEEHAVKKLDWMIILLVVVIAIVALGVNRYQTDKVIETSNGLTAVITVDGERYKAIPLIQKRHTIALETERGKNTIAFYDHGVAVESADCPDHVCVHTGFIHRPGEIIACLPHRVIIEIEGETTEGAMDAIAQ